MPHRTDEQLIEQVVVQDEQAFEVLYDRYSPSAYRLALRMTSDSTDAEDALQEAFLAVWKNASQYNPASGSVQSWLLTAVRNKVIDRQRRKRPQTKLEDSVVDDVNIVETFLQSEQRDELSKALDTLTPEQRQAIDLSFYGGLTQQEIADVIDAPLGTIKARIRRGLAQLKNELDSKRV